MAEAHDSDQENDDYRSWFLQESDDYANWSQDIITASNSIYNKRKLLHKYQAVCEDVFERFPANNTQHTNAKVKIENMLFSLSRCITYWSYMLLARRKKIHWDVDSAPRFGIKPEMKYTPKRYLMSVDTVIKGNVYNWKADFQGDSNFPVKLEDYDSFKDFLSGVLGRIDSYHEKMKQKFDAHEQRQANQGRYQQNRSLNPAEKNLKETLNILKHAMGDAVEKLNRDPNELEKHRENTLNSQLGRKFHGTKHDNDAQVYDQDGDVTYNTKKKMYFSVEGKCIIDMNGKTELKDYQIELVKHFPYRRNRGVHMDTENEHTIKWINSVLPHVSKGWFEIIVIIADDGIFSNYKIQLTPWERRNTTFVRPFVLVAEKSPVHSEGHLISSVQEGFDFRQEEFKNYDVYKPEPFIIHGKGTEIDAMIHSLRALCLIDERHLAGKVENDVEWLYQAIKSDPDNHAKILADESIMKYMRAYFSSDAKTGIVGDKSVFFFNIQGVIAGVEMYAPSLPPYVDLQGRSGGHGTLPRRPQQGTVPAYYTPAVYTSPAPQHLVHPQTIPPEIQEFIEKANKKMEDVEKYMQDHKQALPAQIEKIVREATRNIHAARSAVDFANESAMQENRQAPPVPSAWNQKRTWDAFAKPESEKRPTNVYAHQPNQQKDSAMTHEELERKKEQELQKAEKKRQYEAKVEEMKLIMEQTKYRWSEQEYPITHKEKAKTDGEEDWDYSTFPSDVKGRYNHMYQLQLYPLLRQGVPHVDVAGLVPAEIYVDVQIPNSDESHVEYNGLLKCINSEVPSFEGTIALPAKKVGSSMQQVMADVVITRYVIKNSSNVPQYLVWGIKSKIAGQKKYKYIGYKPLTVVKSNAFLIGQAITQRWKFTHDFEQNEIAENLGSRALVRVRTTAVNTQYQRVPNSTNPNPTDRDRSEKDDMYQVLSVEDLEARNLYGLSPANLAVAKSRQENLVANFRTNKIILHMFSQKHREKLYADPFLGEALKKSINVFSAPMYLRMSSYWLNENPNLDPSQVDPQDGEMCLVDIQGPIYVSRNGKFMVSPTVYESERGAKAITWGIYIWNSNRAQYDLLAVKLCGKHSTHLVNDIEKTKEVNDWELGSEAENYWKQFINFDGLPQVESEIERVQLINFYLPNPDPSMENNPYHMHFRYPDYTISTAEFNVNNEKARARGQANPDGTESEFATAENRFELDEAFHESNVLALEQATQHQLKMLGPKVVIPGNFSHTSRHSTDHANKPVNKKRVFYSVKNDWFVYRTFRAENSLLGHNPWEFAMTSVLNLLRNFFNERLANNVPNDETDQMIESEERRLRNQSNATKRKENFEYIPEKFNPKTHHYRPNGGKQPYQQRSQGRQQRRFYAEFNDDADDYLLRQCFDDPPASQRLPAQPRKLAAPVRTFAPWKPPAAGVSW